MNKSSNKKIKKPTLKLDFLENPKLQLAILIIADIIIIINVIIFVNSKLDNRNKEIPATNITSETQVDIDKVFEESDQNLNSALLNLIKGNYVTSDNKMFSFKADGTYNGYFDAANPDISGGEYNVTMTADGEMVVIITYNNKSIEYVQTYDDSYNFVLTSAEGSFVLFE